MDPISANAAVYGLVDRCAQIRQYLRNLHGHGHHHDLEAWDFTCHEMNMYVAVLQDLERATMSLQYVPKTLDPCIKLCFMNAGDVLAKTTAVCSAPEFESSNIPYDWLPPQSSPNFNAPEVRNAAERFGSSVKALRDIIME